MTTNLFWNWSPRNLLAIFLETIKWWILIFRTLVASTEKSYFANNSERIHHVFSLPVVPLLPDRTLVELTSKMKFYSIFTFTPF